jgi:hypothetical protein
MITGRPSVLTQDDIPRIQALIETLPLPTKSNVAKALGIKERTFRTFTSRHRLNFPARGMRKPIGARGLPAELFRVAAEKGLTVRHISRELLTNEPRVHRWRLGTADMPLFMAQCLADLVGYDLVLSARWLREDITA